jgi:DnaJ-domain-containing protein 1
MQPSPKERLRSYYDLLGVPATAAVEAIKSAFRREIARYHPDKVHHLGPESQLLASSRAADLTAAYRTLMNPATRAAYDFSLANGCPAASASSPGGAGRPGHVAPRQPVSASSRASNTVREPAPASGTAGPVLVHEATISRIHDVVQGLSGSVESPPAGAFDAAYVVRPRRRLFQKSEPPVHLRVKVVDEVNPAAVAAVWPIATRITNADVTPCVLLCGAALAPSMDLAAAISGQRRKHRQTGGPVVIPVDTRDWQALAPAHTPGLVRKLIERLKLGV